MIDSKNLIELINFELECKHYNFKIDFNFLDIKNFENDDVLKKDIMLSLYLHYNFLVDQEIFNLFNIIFIEINKIVDFSIKNNDMRVIKDNDPILLYVFYFYNKKINLISTFYTILILKSFLIDKKNNYKQKSDVVLDNCTNIFFNFLIFFEDKNSHIKSIENRDLRSHFLIIIEYLVKINIISSQNIWINKNGNLVTEKFWGFNLKKNIIILEDFNFFLTKPYIKKYNNSYYLVGNYYSRVFLIFKKNINSNIAFKLHNFDYLNLKNNQEWFIDQEWFFKLLKIIEKFENINFNEINLELEKIMEKLNECNWKDNELQKKYSKYMEYFNILNFYKINKLYIKENPIYFPFFFDFRGRVYYNSNVGITFCKKLRSVYYYGMVDEESLRKNIDICYNELLIKYEGTIEEIKKHYNININYKKIDINIFFVVLSMGRISTSKISYKIHMDIFIENALKSIKNEFIEIKDLQDYIEIKAYDNLLYNIKDFKKRTVAKDFTASFFQHLTRLLGPSTEKTIELSNMKNDLCWYDPYQYLIENFLKENNNIINKKYFNRKFLKKTIMTIPYSIGFNSALKYFNENIDKKDLNNKELIKEYRLFFSFAKKKLEGKDFFKNSTDRIILYAISSAAIFKKFEIKFSKSTVNLTYYNKKTKIIDLTIKINKETLRITKKINEVNNDSIDLENMALSIRANWIATMDAETLRSIIFKINKDLFSIHDCVLIDYTSIDELIIICNEILKNNKFDEISWDNSHNFNIFSFFIIF